TKTEMGCTYTVNHTFNIGESPLPEINLEKPCPGTHVQLHPTGGTVFYFYADADLQELIHKGNHFIFENLNTDTVIYITSIDNLQESPPLAVPITLDNFADFTMS